MARKSMMLFSILAVTGLKFLPYIQFKHYQNLQAGGLIALLKFGDIFYAFAGMISGVMFPYVSERTATGQNTRIFLFGAFVAMFCITIAGTAGTFLFPGILVAIFGAEYEAVQAFVHVIGFAILPLSWLFILNQYFLARHKVGFMGVLYLGIVVQILLLAFFHARIAQYLWITACVNLILCGILVIMGIYGGKVGKAISPEVK